MSFRSLGLQDFDCIQPRDGNGAGFFGYPPRPAPNGTGFKFNKRVWDGYGILFKTRGGFGYYPIPPCPAPFAYKIPNGVPSIWFVSFFNYTSAFRATHNQITGKKNLKLNIKITNWAMNSNRTSSKWQKQGLEWRPNNKNTQIEKWNKIRNKENQNYFSSQEHEDPG